MANQPLSQLPEATSVENDDILYSVVDDVSKKVTKETLFDGVTFGEEVTTVEAEAISPYLHESDIVDGLNSTSTTDVLSANQGRVLNSGLSEVASGLSGEVTRATNAETSLRQAIDAMVSPSGQSVVVDSSLSISGAAADAKVTGDGISALNNQITNVKEDLNESNIAINGIAKNAGIGNDLNDYLFKNKSFINSSLEIAYNDNINLYKIPSKNNGFLLIKWEGNTTPYSGINRQYIITLEMNDGTYSRQNISSYSSITDSSKTICVLLKDNYKSVIIALLANQVSNVSLYVNTLYGAQNQYKRQDCVLPLNENTTPNCPLFLTDTGTFSALAYNIVLWKQVGKDDVVKLNGLASGVYYYGTFTGIDGTKTKITTSSFTAVEDGIICLFDNSDVPLGHYLIPVNQKKVLSENIIGTTNVFNQFTGLDGVAFGTSLTYRAQTTYGYLQHLPDLCGMTFDNQGIGSSYILGNMLTAIKNYTDYADKRVCVLEGFVNDWYYNKTLGTYEDTGETTVCGCVRSAINYMLSQNANLTVILVLDPYGRNYNNVDCSTSAVNASGLTQYEFYEEIAKVGESLGIPVIKLYTISQISENTPQYIVDNIHPTALGAKQTANAIWSIMKLLYPNVI